MAEVRETGNADAASRGLPKVRTYAEFWPIYLGEHRKPATRSLHLFGTGLALVILAVAVAWQAWWLISAAIFSGYFFAWFSHALIERNRPATFTYPLWSLVSDLRMFALWLTGRLQSHLDRHVKSV